MATTAAEIHRIIALTDRTGLTYQMGNQVRYAHCLQDVRRLIADVVLTACLQRLARNMTGDIPDVVVTHTDIRGSGCG